MARILIVTILMLFNLIGCGAGVSDKDGKTKPPVPPKVKLVPLKIKFTDMNNQEITKPLDISLVGSHIWYKIVFTNTNKVAVKISGVGYDENWITVKAKEKHMKVNDYINRYNAGFVAELFKKTNNPDDCLNTKNIHGLAPNSSCAFYTTANNHGLNYNIQTNFIELGAYRIEAVDDENNVLRVERCSEVKVGSDSSYDCSNENKEGYKDFSIRYTMKRVYGGAIDATLFVKNLKNQSLDGKYFYQCYTTVDHLTDRIWCDSYGLNYDKKNNFLKQEAKPTQHVELKDFLVYIGGVYPSNDGSNTWVALYDQHHDYELMNTRWPSLVLRDCLASKNDPCVPDISRNAGPSGVTGLDGSFWWSSNGHESFYDTNNPRMFTLTNMSGGVGAVDKNGVVIGVGVKPNGHSFMACMRRKDPNDPMSYEVKPILNYVEDYTQGLFDILRTSPNGIFIEKPVPNLFMYLHYGEDKYKLQPVIHDFFGYYKIHTENGLCELQEDDYNISAMHNINNQYDIGYQTSKSETYDGVMRASDIYLGKESGEVK